MVTSKNVTVFLIFLPFRKAGGLQIPVFNGICDPRSQGIAVADYSFTLDALALKPSSFCNVGVKLVLFVNQQSVDFIQPKVEPSIVNVSAFP